MAQRRRLVHEYVSAGLRCMPSCASFKTPRAAFAIAGDLQSHSVMFATSCPRQEVGMHNDTEAIKQAQVAF